MDLTKHYIIQSITAASNNLRLNTQKIEVVALLRESLVRSDNLEEDIKKMKKITELSTLAIRLNEIYNYLAMGQVDFFKLSDKFKEHSQYLIKDLSHMLDMVNPETLKQSLSKMKADSKQVSGFENSNKEKNDSGISVDLSKRKPDEAVFEKSINSQVEQNIISTNKLKENLIFEDDNKDEDFRNFEEAVLQPIKPLDTMLKQISNNEINYEELNKYAEIMKKNGELSANAGFDIIANMHKIVAAALILIKTKNIMPGKEVIESMRACLIVIVAVVRGKEVDITNYLNRAEDFGKKIFERSRALG